MELSLFVSNKGTVAAVVWSWVLRRGAVVAGLWDPQEVLAWYFMIGQTWKPQPSAESSSKGPPCQGGGKQGTEVRATSRGWAAPDKVGGVWRRVF